MLTMCVRGFLPKLQFRSTFWKHEEQTLGWLDTSLTRGVNVSVNGYLSVYVALWGISKQFKELEQFPAALGWTLPVWNMGHKQRRTNSHKPGRLVPASAKNLSKQIFSKVQNLSSLFFFFFWKPNQTNRSLQKSKKVTKTGQESSHDQSHEWKLIRAVTTWVRTCMNNKKLTFSKRKRFGFKKKTYST